MEYLESTSIHSLATRYRKCFFTSNDAKKLAEKKLVEKGPVSGFVGDIPLPTLDSRIERNQVASAFYDFATPQKRNMSEGFWLLTLKMTVQ